MQEGEHVWVTGFESYQRSCVDNKSHRLTCLVVM
jgi:hypothetical protein